MFVIVPEKPSSTVTLILITIDSFTLIDGIIHQYVELLLPFGVKFESEYVTPFGSISVTLTSYAISGP